MARLFKNYLFLLTLLLVKNAGTICSVVDSDGAIYKLSESDVLAAKKALEQAERRNQVLRYSLVATGTGLTALLAFKTWQGWADVSKAAPSPKFEFKVGSAALNDLHQRVLKLEKMDALSQSSLERVKGFLLANAPILVLQQILMRAGNLFGGLDLRQLMVQVDLDKHFKRLRIAQIQYDPQAFATNINHQNDLKLCAYAHQVANNFAKMPADKIAELKAEAQAVWIAESNQIIKQMAYIIAYTRYMIKKNSAQSILDNCANQLYLATYDFACKLETAFVSQDTPELFEAVTLLQSTFNITMNNVFIFSR